MPGISGRLAPRIGRQIFCLLRRRFLLASLFRPLFQWLFSPLLGSLFSLRLWT